MTESSTAGERATDHRPNDGEDVQDERLQPRVRILWVIGAIIRSTIMTILLVGGSSLAAGADAVPTVVVYGATALAGAYALAAIILAWLRYARWRFRVRPDSLYLERGVLTQIRTVVPYVRVQHVDSRRTPLERTVGLATVVVYTAGSRSADVAIPGLTPERAEQLREELRRLAIESEGEDAV